MPPKRKTLCGRGHPLTLRKDGRQQCRPCENAAKRAAYRRRTKLVPLELVPFKPEDQPTPEEAAWAAGLFEGEGCIHFRKGTGAPRLSLAMKDRDVVERFQRIVGCGNVGIRSRSGDPFYQWQLYRLAGVRWVLELIGPYLGERRTARVRRAMAWKFTKQRRAG